MPIRVTSTTGGLAHAPVFVTGPLETDIVVCDISDLTINEVDQDGFLKPGVPLSKVGDLVGAAVPVYGVTIEPIRIPHATIPPTNASLAADTGTVQIAVGVMGKVNRDIMEDNLGRALTANEIAGFALADCRVILTRT
jgi:hypothetical protein